MRIVGDAFKQAKNAPLVKPIFLYSLLYDPTSNSYKRWTSWSGGVTFDGIHYDHYPISHSDISEDSTGQIQGATIILSNVNREVQALLDDNEGLAEREITITQVWYETLGDVTAYISDILRVKSATVTERQVALSVSSELDVLGIQIPRRVMTRTFCRFAFKSPECGYAGAEYQCDKTFNRCREIGNQSRFGAFPAIPLQRTYLRGK